MEAALSQEGKLPLFDIDQVIRSFTLYVSVRRKPHSYEAQRLHFERHSEVCRLQFRAAKSSLATCSAVDSIRSTFQAMSLSLSKAELRFSNSKPKLLDFNIKGAKTLSTAMMLAETRMKGARSPAPRAGSSPISPFSMALMSGRSLQSVLGITLSISLSTSFKTIAKLVKLYI